MNRHERRKQKKNLSINSFNKNLIKAIQLHTNKEYGQAQQIYNQLLSKDPNNYDVYVQEAIAHQLAADICYAVTNNATLANNYMQRADERLREARFIDATENSVGTIEANEFTDARL